MPDRLAEQFVGSLGDKLGNLRVETAKLEQVLAGIVGEARQKWPDFETPLAEFLGHLAACIPEGTDVIEALEEMCTSDLYLALACARGAAGAISKMQKLARPALRGILGRREIGSPEAEDIEQRIWDIVLTPRKDQPPRILQYQGRASLKNWIGVIAARETSRYLEKYVQEHENLEDIAERWSGQDEDEELRQIKRIHRAQFKAAMQKALAGLSRRDRNLLRMHLIGGLSPPQIAGFYKVHRFTAYRWLLGIRKTLLTETRKALRRELSLDNQGFESFMRVIDSRLEASIQRFLEASTRSQEEDSG